jgi:hypothetical protein
VKIGARQRRAQARQGALPDQLAFKLGHCRESVEPQLVGRTRGVDYLLKAAEPDSLLLQLLDAVH